MTAPPPRPRPPRAAADVALPQGELLTVNANDNPLIRDALGDGVHFKPLRLDLENGEWVVLATSRPARIPLHTTPARWTPDDQRQLALLRVRRSAADRRLLPLRAWVIGAHAGVP